MKIPKHLINTVADYAEGLGDYFGKHTRTALLDDEDPNVEKALNQLNRTDRDQATWIVGWFRGVADWCGCTPIEIWDEISSIKSKVGSRKGRAA